MDVALRWWEITDPSVAMLPNEYENCHIGLETYVGKYHEVYPVFQKIFLQKWITDLIALKDICNPFEEAELIVSYAGEIIIPEIQLCLGCLLEISKEIYQNFCKNTLIICDAADMTT